MCISIGKEPVNFDSTYIAVWPTADQSKQVVVYVANIEDKPGIHGLLLAVPPASSEKPAKILGPEDFVNTKGDEKLLQNVYEAYKRLKNPPTRARGKGPALSRNAHVVKQFDVGPYKVTTAQSPAHLQDAVNAVDPNFELSTPLVQALSNRPEFANFSWVVALVRGGTQIEPLAYTFARNPSSDVLIAPAWDSHDGVTLPDKAKRDHILIYPAESGYPWADFRCYSHSDLKSLLPDDAKWECHVCKAKTSNGDFAIRGKDVKIV